ncbi:MAG: phospholipase A [Campylobacterota bacterium]|nr:phospholipase A [Campylobacterota bacterium]
MLKCYKVCKFSFFIWILIFSSSILANEYFNQKEYNKAFPIVKEEAENGSKASMYRLGYMYMNGLGVKKDIQKASQWFQKSASQYHYTLDIKPKEDIEKLSFIQRVSNQIDPVTNKRKSEYTFKKMDVNTTETKELISSLENTGFYGLQPYKANYILPFSCSTNKYDNGDLQTEVEFQLSFKKPITYNLFGFNEHFILAYTQKVWWQMYSDSAPFRETNYLPEVYISVPTTKSIDEKFGLKFMKYSFLHESNGRAGYSSRSWNRLYASANWQWDNLFLSTRTWYRIPENKKAINNDPNAKGDDNPDIYKYLGYGDVKINYFFNKHEVGSMFRYNFGMGGKHRGAIDLHWTYPFFGSKNTFLYLRFFNGYGESLIDYDKSVTKSSIGFSLSREVF